MLFDFVYKDLNFLHMIFSKPFYVSLCGHYNILRSLQTIANNIQNEQWCIFEMKLF